MRARFSPASERCKLRPATFDWYLPSSGLRGWFERLLTGLILPYAFNRTPRECIWLRLATENFCMDELVQQLGMAVSNLSSCLPAAEAWNGPAANALALELQEISAEVGGLILDLVSANLFSAFDGLNVG